MFDPLIVKVERKGCSSGNYDSEKECEQLEPMITLMNDTSVEDLCRNFNHSYEKYTEYLK